METSNQLQEFHSEEFGDISVLVIGDKAYFPASECASKLGYVKTGKCHY